jgi:hypothetical protein
MHSDLLCHSWGKLCHSDQDAVVTAACAYCHFCNSGCQVCLPAFTLITILEKEHSRSSYLTHKEIETRVV